MILICWSSAVNYYHLMKHLWSYVTQKLQEREAVIKVTFFCRCLVRIVLLQDHCTSLKKWNICCSFTAIFSNQVLWIFLWYAAVNSHWSLSGQCGQWSLWSVVSVVNGQCGQWSSVVDYGFYKLEVKSKTTGSVEFTTNVSSNHDSGKFMGTLETKYKWKDYGK